MRQKHLFLVIGICFAFVVATLLTLYPLWGSTGWPENHNININEKITYIYAKHLLDLDFFPIWSSVDNDGFGSPLPYFYHKLFYFVSGFLFIIFDNIKAALVAGIGFFIVIGAWGMYRAQSALGGGVLLALLSGLSIIFANYTVTDWLVRGALTELSAAMIVPWAIASFVRSLHTEKIDGYLGVSLGLVFLAHSVIAFYLIFLFATVTIILITVRNISFRYLSGRRIAIAAGIFLIIVSPYLFLAFVFTQEYDLMRFMPDTYLPKNQFQPLVRYFWDDSWAFGTNFSGFTVQLDLPVMILMVCSLGKIIYNYGSQKKAPSVIKYQLILPYFFIFSLAILLQMRFSAPFYEYIPGAKFIQFPWRLLAVITPVAIIIALTLVNAGFSRKFRNIVLVVYMSALVMFCGAFAKINYSYLPILDIPYSSFRISSLVGNEYIPIKVTLPAPTLKSYSYNMKSSACSVKSQNPTEESRYINFKLNCTLDETIALPIYYTKFHIVYVTSPDKLRAAVSCKEIIEFPGLCAVRLSKGSSSVIVEMPTYMRAIQYGWIALYEYINLQF